MLNITPAGLPKKKPHITGFGKSSMSHMALSMLVLGLAAGTALYLIIKRREDAGNYLDQYRKKQLTALQDRAAEGNTSAQVQLAAAYATGSPLLPADPVAAARWNRAAAQAGNPDAQLRLARALTEGEGVEPNLAEAAVLLKKAAEQGSVEAQCTLGIYLFRGIGIPKNLIEGHHWLNRAAAAGSTSAQLALDAARKQMTPDQITEAEKKPLPVP